MKNDCAHSLISFFDVNRELSFPTCNKWCIIRKNVQKQSDYTLLRMYFPAQVVMKDEEIFCLSPCVEFNQVYAYVDFIVNSSVVMFVLVLIINGTMSSTRYIYMYMYFCMKLTLDKHTCYKNKHINLLLYMSLF